MGTAVLGRCGLCCSAAVFGSLNACGSHDVWKSKSRRQFRTPMSKNGAPFPAGGRPEISEKNARNITNFGSIRVGKIFFLRSENERFQFSKRVFAKNRYTWPLWCQKKLILKPSTYRTPGALRLVSLTSYLLFGLKRSGTPGFVYRFRAKAECPLPSLKKKKSKNRLRVLFQNAQKRRLKTFPKKKKVPFDPNDLFSTH